MGSLSWPGPAPSEPKEGGEDVGFGARRGRREQGGRRRRGQEADEPERGVLSTNTPNNHTTPPSRSGRGRREETGPKDGALALRACSAFTFALGCGWCVEPHAGARWRARRCSKFDELEGRGRRTIPPGLLGRAQPVQRTYLQAVCQISRPGRFLANPKQVCQPIGALIPDPVAVGRGGKRAARGGGHD